jgi:uncharacterized SAM-binding protein YcdF (DUF218 family)
MASDFPLRLPVAEQAPKPDRPIETLPMSRRRRWLRRGMTILIVLICLYLFRAPLLRSAARLLVFDEPLQKTEALLLHSGDRVFAEAARLYREGSARRILVIQDYPVRLVRTKILPSNVDKVKTQLGKRGVPDEAFVILDGASRDSWDAGRRLGRWLAENPEATVTVLCDKFATRRARRVLQTVLENSSFSRVHWHALPDRRYDEGNWWKTRNTMVIAFGAFLHSAHLWLYGENKERQPEWDPDQYEKNLTSP